jgi:hypothetical protein
MTRDRRLTHGTLAVAAALTIIGSRDTWFSARTGFYAPDAALMWTLDGIAALLAVLALLGLARRSEALTQLAAMAALMLSGALLVLLVVTGWGTDHPDRGGWITAVAAGAAGAVAVLLLTERGPLGRRARIAVAALIVAAAAAAVLISPDWSHPEVQIIR